MRCRQIGPRAVLGGFQGLEVILRAAELQEHRVASSLGWLYPPCGRCGRVTRTGIGTVKTSTGCPIASHRRGERVLANPVNRRSGGTAARRENLIPRLNVPVHV